MKAVASLLSLLVIPFMVLNLFGGIVAGVWLAFLGEWKVILLGLILLVASNWIVSLLLLPSLAIAGAGAIAIQKGHNAIGWALLIIQSPWLYVVIIGWEVTMFVTFGVHVAPGTWLPIWLWSYGAATGVWAYMARKELQSDPQSNAGFTATGAQIAYIVLSISVIHFGTSPLDALPFMLVPLLIPLAIGLIEMRLRLKHARLYS